MTKQPKSKPLFSLRQPVEIIVKINVRQDGKLIELIHRFRPPTAEDKIKFHRLAGYTEYLGGTETRMINNRREACKVLWDDCIKSIEGYSIEGIKNWKEETPIEHKELAVTRILLEVGVVEGIELKNL